jgi:hypothetical protein
MRERHTGTIGPGIVQGIRTVRAKKYSLSALDKEGQVRFKILDEATGQVSSKPLLQEDIQDVEFFTEGSGHGKRYFLEGIFAQAEIPNKNKRTYPLQVLEREIGRYTKEHVIQGRAWGELGHPPGPNINLERACMLIKEFRQDRANFIGKGLITSTPMGDIVRGLMDDGANLGVSTRALGSLKPLRNGIDEVQSDLRLLAVDVVADPSAPQAFVKVVMEDKTWVWDAAEGNYIAEEYADDIRTQVGKMSLPQIREISPLWMEHFVRLVSRGRRSLGTFL